MPNRLQFEQSPYLLQHRENPVDWHPWGSEAFQAAREEGKPVFLSIGYSTCHWCHVMARESFADEEVADALNRDFISIKVDREERPISSNPCNKQRKVTCKVWVCKQNHLILRFSPRKKQNSPNPAKSQVENP